VSDTSGAFPPPPPPSVPPPAYGAPPPPPPIYTPPPPTLPKGYTLPPGYQGPIAPDYAQPYQGYPQPYGQYQQQVNPGGMVFGSTSALGYQFGGRAIYAIIAGLITIIAPFAFGIYFIGLPIIGIVTAIRAITAGRLMGGVLGLGLSVVGGIVSLWASGTIG
jgi:hypothetical protein